MKDEQEAGPVFFHPSSFILHPFGVAIMDPIVAAVLGAAGAVLLILLAFVLTGASPGKLGLGMAVMRKAAQDPEFEKKVDLLLNPPPPEPPKPVKPSGAPLRLLAVMQRESRLIDFLMEDLHGADESQIAAAVRDIQPRAQGTLKKYLTLEPVLPESEGSDVTVA